MAGYRKVKSQGEMQLLPLRSALGAANRRRFDGLIVIAIVLLYFCDKVMAIVTRYYKIWKFKRI